MSSQCGEKRARSEDGGESVKPTSDVAVGAKPSSSLSITPSDDPLRYEREHVHKVYDAIAPHFSSTRYRPWPHVRDFVQGYVANVVATHKREGDSTYSAPSVWLADVGCGNGKNMCIPPTGGNSKGTRVGGGEACCSSTTDADGVSIFAVGCDRSIPLMRAAQLGAVRRKEFTVTTVTPPPPPSTTSGVLPNSGAASVDPPLQAKAGESLEAGGGTSTTSIGDEQTTPTANTKNTPESTSRKGGKVKKIITKSTAVDVPDALLKGLEMVGSDGLSTPFRTGLFDLVLSIAVIHHFSNPERRREAVRELLRLVRPGTGRVLIYVWAKEQQKHRGDGCDVMIPWEMHQAFDSTTTTYQRYYHLFTEGELEGMCRDIDEEGANATSSGGIRCTVERTYFDKENWCVVLSRPAM